MPEPFAPRPRLAADGMLIIVALFWGTSFAVMKQALAQTGPANLLFLRFSLAFLLLLPAAWSRRQKFSPRLILPGLIAGLFMFGGFITQLWGLTYTTASRSGFITGLNVVLVPLLAIVLLRRLPTRTALIGAGLAFGGLYFLTAVDQTQGTHFNLGDLLTLICALFWAGYIISLAYFSPGRDSYWLTLIQMATVIVGALIFAVASGQLSLDLSPGLLGASLYLAGFCTVVAFWGQTWAQGYTSPTRTAIILTLEPVFAALFAWWWLGERMGRWGLWGSGLILAGLLLAQVRATAWKKG